MSIPTTEAATFFTSWQPTGDFIPLNLPEEERYGDISQNPFVPVYYHPGVLEETAMMNNVEPSTYYLEDPNSYMGPPNDTFPLAEERSTFHSMIYPPTAYLNDGMGNGQQTVGFQSMPWNQASLVPQHVYAEGELAYSVAALDMNPPSSTIAENSIFHEPAVTPTHLHMPTPRRRTAAVLSWDDANDEEGRTGDLHSGLAMSSGPLGDTVTTTASTTAAEQTNFSITGPSQRIPIDGMSTQEIEDLVRAREMQWEMQRPVKPQRQENKKPRRVRPKRCKQISFSVAPSPSHHAAKGMTIQSIETLLRSGEGQVQVPNQSTQSDPFAAVPFPELPVDDAHKRRKTWGDACNECRKRKLKCSGQGTLRVSCVFCVCVIVNADVFIVAPFPNMSHGFAIILGKESALHCGR